MKRTFFLGIFFTIITTICFGQEWNYSCGFEDVHENARWYFVNPNVNKWYIGNATSYQGAQSLYLSNNNGTSYVASPNSKTKALAYREIYLTTGATNVSFVCKRPNYTEFLSSLHIFLIPSNVSIPDFSSINYNSSTVVSNYLPSGSIYLGQVSPLSSWHALSYNITISSSSFYKLCFFYLSNDIQIVGFNSFQPAAIDNVTITNPSSDTTVPVALNVYANGYFASYTITGGGTYNYLDTAEVKVDVVDHYHITGWSNNLLPFYMSSTMDSLAIFMDGNYTLIVDVAKDTHIVSVNSRGGPMPSVSNNGQIPYMEPCTITADTTNSYWRFLSWSNYETSNPYTFVVTGDTTMIAIYLAPNENAYRLQTLCSTPNAGYISITGTQLLGEYYFEGNITLTAIANYGYHFVQWSDGVMSNTRTINLSQDTYLTAIFAPNQYTLSLSSNDVSMGTTSGGGTFDYLSQVTISAIPSPHYHFVQWSDGSTTNPRILTLTQNTSLVAIFAQDPQYIITVTSGNPTRGSVDGGGIFYAGEYVTLSANANEHYYFSSWSDGVTANPYYLTVIENASYTAFFEPINFMVNLTTNDDYMGSVYGSGAYPYGSTANIEAQPFDGFRFIEWSDGNTNASRTLTILDDISLQARFGDANSEGIYDVDGTQYSIRVHQGRIIVEGIDDSRVRINDVVGRTHALNEQLPTGVYMLRIDNRVTKKVVVM